MTALAPWLTRPEEAARVAEFALRGFGGHALRILEPSAGEGALVRALLSQTKVRIEPSHITAVELHRDRAAILRRDFPGVRVINRCFLSWVEDMFEDGGPDHPPFDLVVMNPPYDEGQDAEHVEAASVVGKRVTALVRGVFRHGGERSRIFDSCALLREAVFRGRPGFDDREGGKDGSPRHEFEALTIERMVGRRVGWTREKYPRDSVEVEWW